MASLDSLTPIMASLDSLTPDRDQIPIIQLSLERNMVVTGCAGSGKSLVMLKKAKQAAAKTQSYAIVVYTKSLKQFFMQELKEIDQQGRHVYYLNEWKRLSQQPKYEYLFVDECQDFNHEEISNFLSHGKYCWFFGDTEQSIMSFPDHSVQSVRATANQVGVHTQTLGINHRLTIENAKVGEYMMKNNLSRMCEKHGPKPLVIKTDDIVEKIIEIKNNSGANDIGVLLYYVNDINKIKEELDKRGVPVEFKTKDEMHLNFKSTNIKMVTFHCSKGLQFDTVIIPYCGYSRWEKNALYVAATRPLQQLYFLYDNQFSSFLPSTQSPIYGTTNDINDEF